MHLGLGVAVVLAAWLGLRISVGARLIGGPVLALGLDLLAPAIGFLLLLGATGRPVLSAIGIAAAAAGLVLTDRVKRAVLREPVVFADRAELLEVVRHPRLYLPFAGTGLVLGGAAAIVAAVAGLAWLETPIFPMRPLFWPLLALLGWACFLVPAQPPLLPALARRYARLPVTREPGADMASLGMLATFVVHATLARAERGERQRRACEAPLATPLLALPPTAGPIVLVQSESWFDVGRLHPALAGSLPGIEALRRGAALHGRLAVPAWGANTVRSEFAALTGLDEAAIGLDRFNPYAGFARARLPSIAWHARRAGYRAVCVHPFDLSFYGRSRVLPQLGFDRLIGPEAFRGLAREGEWVSDLALGEAVARLLAEGDGKLLVFAITMECHGPWDAKHGDGDVLPEPLAGVAGADELGRYLKRLRGADALVPVVADALRRRGGPGWLAFYGDHQPTLPATFAALGMADPRSDYLIWGTQGAPGGTRDLAAHELGAALTEVIAR